jgi:hypothetical protein
MGVVEGWRPTITEDKDIRPEELNINPSNHIITTYIVG